MDNQEEKKISIQDKIKNINWKYVGKEALSYVVLIAVLLMIRSSVLGNYKVPTGSMKPTIMEGDFFFANKLAYRLKVPFSKKTIIKWSQPKRGDIIAFRYPMDEKIDYTKRVIGLPGDTIELKNKTLYVNGKKITSILKRKIGEFRFYEENLFGKKYTVKKRDYADFQSTVEKIKIPKKMYYCMGDNRDNSSDSRVWGFVPEENIEGKLFFRWFTLNTKTVKGFFKNLTRIGPM
jgi:signal peptidase I